MKKLPNAYRKKERQRLLFWVVLFVAPAVVSIAGIFFQRFAHAASAPYIITYQGKLLESGASVTTTKAMGFLIYTDPTAGSIVYTASGTLSSTSTVNVTPSQGIFSLDLGATGTNSLDPTIFQNNSVLYLEVWVSSTVLTPRKRLTSAPYAVNSEYLMGYAATNTSSSVYIPVSDSRGNFQFTGNPQSGGISGGIIYINPTSTVSDYTLLGVAVNGSERFKVDREGDTSVSGTLRVSSTLFVDSANNRVGINTLTPAYSLSVSGTAAITNTTTLYSDLLVSGANAYIATGTAFGTSYSLVVGNGTTGAIISGGHIAPSHTNLFDLGRNGLGFGNLYASSTLTIGSGGVSLSSFSANTLAFAGATGLVSSTAGNLRLAADGSNQLQFWTNGTQQLLIDSSGLAGFANGFVSFASSSVSGGLRVSGALNASSTLLVAATSTLASTTITNLDVDSGLLYVDNINNRVGINTLTPAYTLSVSGTVAITNTTTLFSDFLVGATGESIGDTGFFFTGNDLYIEDKFGVNGVSYFDGQIQSSSTLLVGSSAGTDNFFVNGSNTYVATGTAYGTSYSLVVGNGTVGAIIAGGHIAPSHTNLFDLGRNGLGFGNLYASSTVTVGSGGTLLTTLQSNALAFSGSTGVVSSTAGNLRLAADGSNQLEFWTNGAQRLVIDSTGFLTMSGFVSTASSSVTGGLRVSGALNASSTLLVAATSTLASTTITQLNVDSGLLYVDNINNRIGINSSTPNANYMFSVSGTTYLAGTSTVVDLLNVEGKVKQPVRLSSLNDATNLGQIFGVFVQGDYAYIASFNQDRLTIVDISNPQAPVVLSTVQDITNLDGAIALYVSGRYAYIAARNNNSLTIVDVGDPERPVIVGIVKDSTNFSNIHGVHVSGNYAYVSTNVRDSLEIIDVSDPSNPRRVSGLQNATALNGATYVYVSGNYAYVTANDNDSLAIVDISDPLSPRLTGQLVDDNNGADMNAPRSVFVSGKFAYVAVQGNNSAAGTDDGGDALVIVDISDPTTPTTTASLQDSTNLNGAHSVFVSGDYAYVATRENDSFEVIDVASSTNPVRVGSIQDSTNLNDATSVFVSGNYAYVGTAVGTRFSVFDISGATISNADIGTARIGNVQVMSHAFFDQGVNIRGGLMVGPGGLLISGNFGLSAPTTTNYATALNATNTLSFSHRTIFSASSTNGNVFGFETRNTVGDTARLLSIKNNGTERLTLTGQGYLGIGSSTPNFALSVSGTAWISATTTLASTTVTADLNVDSGLLYVDTINNRIGINSSTPSANYTVSVSGTTYLAGTSTVTDLLSVPGKVVNPQLVSTTKPGGADGRLNTAHDVFVSGDYAYIANYNGSGSIEIMDIANKERPTTTATYQPGNFLPRRIIVSGKYAYVANGSSGNEFVIIDISDPFRPTTTARIAPAGFTDPWGMFISGKYAYVGTDDTNTFFIIDISDPANPFVATSTILAGATGMTSVYVSGNYAYISDRFADTMYIFDISDPINPVLASTVVEATQLDSIRDIVVRGKYAYVAAYNNDSLAIVDISNPVSSTIVNVFQPGGANGRLNGVHDLAVSGNYLYAAADLNDSVEVIDISSSTNPVSVATLQPNGANGDLNGATSVFLSGNYLYVTAQTNDSMSIFDVSGATISNAEIGTVKITHAQFMAPAFFDQTINVRGGAMIGTGGLLVRGDFSMSAATSTIYPSALIATNTLRFSHRAHFIASSTNGLNFIFDTANTVASSTSNYVFSVRNNTMKLFSVSSNGDVRTSGTLYAARTDIGTPGSPGDVTERVDVNPQDIYEPGDVLVVDHDATDRYQKSNAPYAREVSGVVSTQPVIVIGSGKTGTTADMAIAGRVPVKISDENGPIERGDMLVTASLPGHAMRYDARRDDGATMAGIVGIALDSFATGTGKILAILKDGWVNNRQKTIAEIQQDLIRLAETNGVDIATDPADVRVTEQDGRLVVGNEPLNLQGNYVFNVGAIFGKDSR
ncbi:MAG: hypothetical protein AAB932_00200, partial [Patescibacteria group bacterium]